MFLAERLSKRIASDFARKADLSSEREEILAYGAFSLIQTLWAIIVAAFFGLVFGLFFNSLLITFSAAFLRKYSGGAHATSPNRCAFIGALLFVLLAYFVDMLLNAPILVLYGLLLLQYLFVYIVQYQYCPVDSPAKPIRKEETKKRLRKQSFALISILAVLSAMLLLFYSDQLFYVRLILCVSTGIMWQTFTLTSAGHFLIEKSDALLKHIANLFTGGEKNEKSV